MLIGLHGKKQAGKDTVHQRIEKLLGPGSKTGATVERASFADKLYESAAAALGTTPGLLRQLKADDYALVTLMDGGGAYTELTVREYLQAYGTEAHRNIFGGSFWVDNLDLRDHAGKIVVVTDVRFREEAQAVGHAGGWVVQVLGPDEVENAGDGHASEEPLSDWLIDRKLFNTRRDDNFADLDLQVMDIVLALVKEDRR